MDHLDEDDRWWNERPKFFFVDNVVEVRTLIFMRPTWSEKTKIWAPVTKADLIANRYSFVTNQNLKASKIKKQCNLELY